MDNPRLLCLRGFVHFFLFLAVGGAVTSLVVAQNPKQAVLLTQDEASFTLSNAFVTARIDKQSGSITSLAFDRVELLAKGQGRSNGYWSLPGSPYGFGTRRVVTVIMDPLTNDGNRAIVSCKFLYDGKPESVPADVDFRYTLGRLDRGIYLQANWEHKPEFPALSFGVGRFAAKLNDDVFDWMTIDARRSMQMITAYDWNHGTQMNMKEARLMKSGVMKGIVEHKYDYAAVQFDTPAYGWSSSTKHIGIWMVTASNEYMSGGPTKLELSAHRDATFTNSLTAPAPATLLNVWKGPHYGGTSLVVASGEQWSKVIGPFMLYCNAGPSPQAMWKDALVKAKLESQQWPYSWATGDGYAPKEKRGDATGQISLRDPLSPNARMTNLLVGLTAPDYSPSNRETVDWQKDAKFYQFWVHGDESGKFKIPNVLPGKYTLHAFADGVLGEYVKTDITVASGQSINLGNLVWTPVRFGRQLWEIGIPDRTAGEFAHGDHYWQWGLYYQYPKDFPNDVNFVIGLSDYRKDWNIMQVPSSSGEGEKGSATTWTIKFDLPKAPNGRATLRLAFAGTEAHRLAVAVNDQPAGVVDNLPNTGVIHRDSDRGYWQEMDVAFDASLMKAGTNTLKLTVPPGGIMNGIEYDYLRLELDETGRMQ